jgi:uncharacterized RDD family membrane protein YckC
MLKQKSKDFLNEASSLPKPQIEAEIPIITVGDPFLNTKDNKPVDNLKYAGLAKRFLARIIDMALVLALFALLSGFVTSAVFNFIPAESASFLEKQLSQSTVSLEESSKLLTCDVSENDKDICNKTLPYLNWVNFSNIITLLVIHSLFFVVLTKLKFNTPGKKLLKLKVKSSSNLPISWLQSIAREIIWISTYIFLALSYLWSSLGTLVLMMIWIQIGSFVLILTRSTKTGVHDIIAQSIVLNK